jgi:hypothetical protein
LPGSPKCWQSCNHSRVSSHELPWKLEDLIAFWCQHGTVLFECKGSKFNFVSVEFSAFTFL